MKKIFTKYSTLIKYFFIGISAAGIDVSIYIVLFNIFDLPALISTSISIAVATVYAFTLNKVYNFQVKGNTFLRLLSYSLVSGVGLLISLTLLYIFTEVKGYDGNLIKIISLPIIFVVQYVLNKKITFSSFKGDKN
jgi:putative flippase GtrA